MKQHLQDILFGVSIQQVIGNTNQIIENLYLNSKEVQSKGLFVAIKGEQLDGHQFILQAVDNGATCIVCEKMPDVLGSNTTYIQVDNSRKAVAVIAANFYEHPSKKIKLVGVTGTNGKTTIVTLLHQLFTQLGVVTGLLSTIENKIGEVVYPSTLTTPDSISLNRLLYDMVQAGVEVAFMEVSSHAIEQYRIAELYFTGGVFTNITRDHLNYHQTFKAYIQAKQKFFTQLPKESFALYNEDDKNGHVMVQNSKARKISYGLQSFADYKVKILEHSLDGLLLNMNGMDVYTRLTGEFNALNLIAVYAVAIELGEDSLQVYEKISAIQGASGRFEKVISSSKIVGIIDYAHTPDSLEKTLQSINDIRSGIEQLITVVGAGGDRDKGKRPLMAEIAASLSDKVLLTSDNPRSEQPIDIINDMLKGVKITQRQKVLTILDRKEAIRTAITMATSGDIVLIAGKGHENYQEINGKRFPFDDHTILREAFSEFKK